MTQTVPETHEMATPIEPAADENRIDRLESRIAIADLVHRYALNVRTRKGGESAELFTEDGIFETRDGVPGQRDAPARYRLKGRDAIREYVAGQTTSGVTICPMIHNLIIELDGDDATSTCVMVGPMLGTDKRVMGEYLDTFRRDGEWRFASRIFTIFG